MYMWLSYPSVTNYMWGVCLSPSLSLLSVSDHGSFTPCLKTTMACSVLCLLNHLFIQFPSHSHYPPQIDYPLIDCSWLRGGLFMYNLHLHWDMSSIQLLSITHKSQWKNENVWVSNTEDGRVGSSNLIAGIVIPIMCMVALHQSP